MGDSSILAEVRLLASEGASIFESPLKMGCKYTEVIICTGEPEGEMKVLEPRHIRGHVRKRSRKVCAKSVL